MTGSVSATDEGMRLEEAGLWCARLADGLMSREEQRGFEAWLDADPRNRAAFDRAAAAWQAFEAVGVSPELIVMRSQALEGFGRANRRRWRRSGASRWNGLAAAAGLLVCLLVGALWMSTAPRAYGTGVGERRMVALADGSELSLDADTRVEVRYRKDRRELWLRKGRAKFAVAKDPLRPFTVAAAGKVVVATGTEFSVELLRKQMRVVLYEGSVAVAPATSGRRSHLLPQALSSRAGLPEGGPVAAPEVLTPGRELIVALEVPRQTVVRAEPVRSLAGEGGQLIFDDEPLASAVERVNRYSQEKLSVADATAAAAESRSQGDGEEHRARESPVSWRPGDIANSRRSREETWSCSLHERSCGASQGLICRAGREASPEGP